jgi:diguanylate cyclase (GGDEF)-like protein/PAS domain S-box-containing protein
MRKTLSEGERRRAALIKARKRRRSGDAPTHRRRKRGVHAVTIARAETKAALAEARQAHARLKDAIDILPHGLVFLDAEGRYILWNRQYADIYKRSADLFAPGVKLEETLRIGVERGDYPDAIGREEEWIARRLDLMRNPAGRHEQLLSDGRVIMIEERRTSDGGVIGLRVDISEMKKRETSFRLLFDANPVPMFVLSAGDRQILAANHAAVAHYGFASNTLLAMRFREIDADPDSLGALGEGGDADIGLSRKHRQADGKVIDVALFARGLTYGGGAATLIAAIDITERKRAEARIAFMAHHDALTSLPNRILLRLEMEQALTRIERHGKMVAVMCIDLDNFKAVNDTLGHPLGDLLLQAVAERLEDALRQVDTVARLGGDEFAVLQAEVGDPAEVTALAQRLLAALQEPVDLDGHQVAVGASIGIALAPGDGADVDRLLKNADIALYRAKADGKATFRFFEPEMDARVQARRRLEVDLRAAMQSAALDVHYQPLVDLDSSRISGFEALIRWRHPLRGEIPPAEFIPVAEESGLISQIGSFVLRKACRDAARWPSDVRIAVNLSPVQFRPGNLLQLVTDALAESGLTPDRLELEITESLLLEKSDQVVATLHTLRALGVRIAMDDFGTGYSSLSYLRSFPFDKIKIDRSFIHDLASNADSRAIVRAIVSLGASLGMTITAEGVEEEVDLNCLRAEGCTEAQGHLFSHARPIEEATALLQRRSVKAA